MPANEVKMDYGVEDLKQNMISLFNHRESADLTLVCVCQEFKIHSVLLCPRSTFFQAAFEGGFKEGLAKRIDLPEDDPHLISKLICYCYTTDYELDPDPDPVIAEDAFTFPLQFHAGMYAMAEKFDMKNLKKLAEKKFATALHVHEPRVRTEIPGNEALTRVLEVIGFIYNTTPENDRGLRDIIVGHVAQHWYAFLALRQFKRFMATHTDFIIEVIEAKESVCSRCQKYAAWGKECSSLSSWNSIEGW